MAKDGRSLLCSYRFLIAIVAFFAYAAQYTQKINMSVAIVCMVNNTALKLQDPKLNLSSVEVVENKTQSSECGVFESSANKTTLDGPFLWPKKLQGVILSSYFFGYLITEIPGGYMSMRFGPKLVLGISVLISSIFTLLLPFAARFHYITLGIFRFIIGAAHGVVWPAFAGFWANWAPPAERSRLIGIANAGAQIGNVIALPLGGFLCVNGFDGGWPSIFYVFGIAGLVWCAVWFATASDSPDDNRFIGDNEKEFILNETKETRSSHSEGESNAPWLAIMTSKAAIGIFIGHTCSNWGTYLFLTSLPSYMKEVLKFDIKSNGALSAVPYLVFWFFIILSGMIGDLLIQKLNFTKTTVRRIFNIFAFIMPMFAVIGLVFVTCQYKYVGVALLTMGLAFTGCGYGAGFLVNYNDIAGTYSGVVFGIGNTFATLPGIIAPYLVGMITKNQKQEEWQIVFIITACVYLIGAIVLFIFTSGKVEPWATKKKTFVNPEESLPLKNANA